MAEYDKVVFIKHAVETLGYFSKQMAETFRKEGFAICFVDYEDLFASLGRVRKFVEPGRTLLVTFNYIGLSGEDVFEDEGGKTIWESHGLLIFNILVDHPSYFHSKLVKEHANMQLFCVDREHVAYLQRFYPACRADFLPLAGNLLQGAEVIPYEKRQYDLVFTANYVPLTAFRERMRAQGEEYRSFTSASGGFTGAPDVFSGCCDRAAYHGRTGEAFAGRTAGRHGRVRIFGHVCSFLFAGRDCPGAGRARRKSALVWRGLGQAPLCEVGKPYL